MNELTQLFGDLSKVPADVSSYQVHILKKYVIFVYYGKVDSPIDIDIQRMRDFEYSTYVILGFSVYNSTKFKMFVVNNLRAKYK